MSPFRQRATARIAVQTALLPQDLALHPVDARKRQNPCKNHTLGSGLGPTFGISTEFVLFARRGSLAHKEHHSGTCFTWKRGRHSEKPEAFYRDVVEKVSPGPYAELFGRRPRPGWTIWGNDLTREAQLQGVVSAA